MPNKQILSNQELVVFLKAFVKEEIREHLKKELEDQLKLKYRFYDEG